MPVIPAIQEAEEHCKFEANLDKVWETLPQKREKKKKPGSIAQVKEFLSCKGEALDSIPSTAKQNKNEFKVHDRRVSES
jgi:hypothetical protein